MTGDSLRLERATAMREAGCPFIEKPFEPGEVRRVVREQLRSTPTDVERPRVHVRHAPSSAPMRPERPLRLSPGMFPRS